MSGPAFDPDLFAQLASDKRSVVIGAVVRAAKVASDPETLFRLRKLAESSDREVSFFAAQAVAKIQARLGQDPEVQAGIVCDLDRANLLAPLKSEIPGLLRLVRERRDQIPDDLKPAVAVFLSKNGGEEDVAWLTEQARKTDSNLVLPFIDALEARSSSALQPLLPVLLASTHPLVRGKAITVLRRIRPAEAEAHLTELLASQRQEDRLTGLSIGLLFPFSQVRERVFSILREDRDPEVMKGCGTLLASNPEIESAFRLLDLIDTVDKHQRGALSSIFRVLCQALEVAGLLPAAESSPGAVIARWRQERSKASLPPVQAEKAPDRHMETGGEEAAVPNVGATPLADPVEAPAAAEPTPEPRVATHVRAFARHRYTAPREETPKPGKEPIRRPGGWKFPAPMLWIIALLSFLPLIFLRACAPARPVPALPPELFDPRASDERKFIPSEIPDGVRMNRMGRIIARFKEVLPDGHVLVEHENVVYRLEGIATLPPLLENDMVKVELLPYQRLKDGTIMAECHSFKPHP